MIESKGGERESEKKCILLEPEGRFSSIYAGRPPTRTGEACKHMNHQPQQNPSGGSQIYDT